MSGMDHVLCCTVNIEWLNKQGIILRKLSQKNATLRLIRDEKRDIFVEITAAKSAATKLALIGISVHKNFMKEGKASIKFQPLNCTMYLSNAPPGQLLAFLKTIFVKKTNEINQKPNNTSLRTQLLSGKPQQFQEISPVTTVEISKAMTKVKKSSNTTPSPLASKKRKIDRTDSTKPPAAKKLYSSSPIPQEPLDIEQKDVLDACLAGHNVFFTGSAGTGKSYLLKKIIGVLPPDTTVATASTGVAACHIGGVTLHQFAAIGDGEATLERSIQLASRPPGIGAWRKCKHLVIDEISMVDGDYFDKIEQVARRVRNSDKPFGGIQLILCGDFLQLPPICRPKPGENKKWSTPKFCFQTRAWESCRLNAFELKRVHRQSDEAFIAILNKIRIGQVDDEVTKTLENTARQKIERDGILATRLCSHTKDADIINESKLRALPGESRLFECEDLVSGSTKQLDLQTPVPSRLELRVGAQVMLLKNISVTSGLVNGARGVVTAFEAGMPVVKFRGKQHVAKAERWTVKTAAGASLTRKQVPLKLAWAFSIHKSQGLTLDCVEMSLGRVFEAGQAYVALSRAQSLESLRVLDFKAAQVWANGDVLSFYRRLDNLRAVPLGPANRVASAKGQLRNKKLTGLRAKFLDKPRQSSSVSGAIEHECKLQAEAEEDVLKQIIDTGILINTRRKLCRLTMVSRDHPRTPLYYKSGAACRRESVRHLLNYLVMSHPFCLWGLYWEFFMFFVYGYMYFVCSVSVAYLNQRKMLDWMNLVRFGGDFVLLVDIIHLFFMGYYSTERSRSIMKPSEVAKHYLMTYFFVDFFSSMPSYCLPLTWFWGIDEFNTPSLRILRTLSILKVFRIGRWLESLELFRQYMNYSSYWFKAIRAVLLYLVLIMLLYAALFSATNLVFEGSQEYHIMHKFERFYKATMIILVVTHGKDTLRSTKDIAVISFFLCMGYIMQLFLYAEVMQVWNKFASARNKNDNLLLQFTEYMKYKGLPMQIREKIFLYFNFKFQNEFFNEAQINSMVSDILKQEILMHMTKVHLEKAHFFKGIPQNVLMKIVAQLKSEIFLPDDVIVTAGTQGTCMYFIYFGTVAVYTSMGKEICHLEDGSHFGEISLVFNEPRIATVVAVTPCELFKLRRSDFLEVIEPLTELKSQIMTNARDMLIRSRVESF